MKKRIIEWDGHNYFLLGKDKEGIYYWLREGDWQCGWYWGIGYVNAFTNNKRPEVAKDIQSHQHFDKLFLDAGSSCFEYFKILLVETCLNDSEIWILLELMQSIYTLKKVAELYQLKGSGITLNPCEDFLDNEVERMKINEVIIPAMLDEVYKLWK